MNKRPWRAYKSFEMDKSQVSSTGTEHEDLAADAAQGRPFLEPEPEFSALNTSNLQF